MEKTKIDEEKAYQLHLPLRQVADKMELQLHSGVERELRENGIDTCGDLLEVSKWAAAYPNLSNMTRCHAIVLIMHLVWHFMKKGQPARARS